MADPPIQCAWCHRFKGKDGWPVGPVLSLEQSSTHGICRDCGQKLIAFLDLADPPPVSDRNRRSPRRYHQGSPSFPPGR